LLYELLHVNGSKKSPVWTPYNEDVKKALENDTMVTYSQYYDHIITLN